jgi:hypothetical protein
VGTAPFLNYKQIFDATPPSSARAFLCTGTAAVTGAMVIELIVLRLYAAYFGNSIYVWGRMISVLMLKQAGSRLGCTSWRKERRRNG